MRYHHTHTHTLRTCTKHIYIDKSKIYERSKTSIQLLFVYQKALIPVLRLKNNFCKFTTHTQKFKRLFCTKTLILNTGLKDSDRQIHRRLRMGMANLNNTYLRLKINPTPTRNLNF